MKKIIWDWSSWTMWWRKKGVYPDLTGWWKRPAFDFSGIHECCPYIWFAYWLIVWDEKSITISFLPD